LQTRSFCYVDDTIEGLVRLMDSPDEVTGPINIGNPSEISVQSLAEMIVAKTAARVEFERRELQADDPRQRKPDIGRARAVMGWEPKVSLESGLDRTIDYFKTLLGASPAP